MDNPINQLNMPSNNDVYEEIRNLLEEINNIRTANNSQSHNTRNPNLDRELLFITRDLMRNYGQSMQSYHANITSIIQLLTTLHQPYPPATVPPISTTVPPISPTVPIDYNRILYYYFTRNPTRQPNTNGFYNNVIVRPTNDQIQVATTNYLYSIDSVTGSSNTNCPITMDEFQDGEEVCRILHCGHTFRQEAISQWFETNVRCPVCRYDIRDYNINHQRQTDVNHSAPVVTNDRYANFRNRMENNILEIINEYYTEADLSNNQIYTFEFPLYYDLSGGVQSQRMIR